MIKNEKGEHVVFSKIKQMNGSAKRDLQARYDELQRKYDILEEKYNERSNQLNSAKNNNFILLEQLCIWSRRFQRLKLSISVAKNEVVNFEQYVHQQEDKQKTQEMDPLELLLYEIEKKNNEASCQPQEA